MHRVVDEFVASFLERGEREMITLEEFSPQFDRLCELGQNDLGITLADAVEEEMRADGEVDTIAAAIQEASEIVRYRKKSARTLQHGVAHLALIAADRKKQSENVVFDGRWEYPVVAIKKQNNTIACGDALLAPKGLNLCSRLEYPPEEPIRFPVDTLTPQQRSERMSRVRNKNTKPEWIVRRLLWKLGFRYQLHGGADMLPGKPDIVFPRFRKVIFVHGCFWHRHPGCRNCRLPKSRLEFWRTKLRANRFRDLRNQRALRRMGWDFHVVWECEIEHPDTLASRFIDFLDETAAV